jgi:hypothetical protein
MHLLLASGSGAGKYFEITHQTDADVTLDVGKFDLTDVTINDIVTVNIAFVENVIHDNTVYLEDLGYAPIGYGQDVSFSFWGSCFGNYIHDNHVVNSGPSPSYAEQSMGYADLGIIVLNTNHPTYQLNSKNVLEDNTVQNCYTDFHIGTLYYNDTYWLEETGWFEGLGKITDSPLLGIQSIGAEVRRNEAIGTYGYSSVHNSLNTTWENNRLARPSMIYDEHYQSARSGQPALGGDTSTTWLSYLLLSAGIKQPWGVQDGVIKASSGASSGVIKNSNGVSQ